jgi:hypothetical protein
MLRTWPEDMDVILHSLVKHSHAPICKGNMHALIEQAQEHAERLYSLQFVFTRQAHFSLLEEAIQKDIMAWREYLLKLILLQYNDQRILKSLHGISSGKKELASTSFELLEQVCGVHSALRFSTLFEAMGQTDRKHHLQQTGRFHVWDTSAALLEIAERRNPAYSPWVQTLSMYLVKNFPEWVQTELLEKKKAHPNKMVRETAAFVLAE